MMGAKVSSIFEYERRTLKSGKPSKVYSIGAILKVCGIERCEICGRWGSETWVRHWYDPTRWPPSADRPADYEPGEYVRRCMGCFNRIRPLWGAQTTLWENNRLIRKIIRDSRHAKA